MAEAESARETLAQAVLDHLLGGGAGDRGGLDQSLRGLASAVGVGHSLLLYHFGSKNGLLTAVHDACERRERDHLAAFRAEEADRARRAAGRSPGGQGAAPDPFTTMRRMWRHLAEPRMWPLYRIAFALRARDPGADDSRAPWVEALLPLVRAVGVPPGRAPAEALLWIATCRGLLWELVTGADPAAVDAAAEAFHHRYLAGAT